MKLSVRYFTYMLSVWLGIAGIYQLFNSLLSTHAGFVIAFSKSLGPALPYVLLTLLMAYFSFMLAALKTYVSASVNNPRKDVCAGIIFIASSVMLLWASAPIAAGNAPSTISALLQIACLTTSIFFGLSFSLILLHYASSLLGHKVFDALFRMQARMTRSGHIACSN